MVPAATKVAGPELAPAPAEVQVQPSAAGRIRCMLVQSRGDGRRAVARIVGHSSHRLELIDATSIGEARALLADGGIDLVLLDPMLPDGDGLGFLTELGSDAAHAGIPVIIVARESDSERVVQAMRSGAADYLVTDGLTVTSFDHAVARAVGPDAAMTQDIRERIGDLRQEVIGLRRTAARNMRLLKAQSLPLLAFAWKAATGEQVDEGDQPALARRLVRLTRSITALIDETAIMATTRHGAERPVPVDLGQLVGALIAGDLDELRAGAAHVRCGTLPALMARRSHMTLLFRELLLNAVRSARLGAVPEIELGSGADADGNPIIWMTENGLPLSARKQALGGQGGALLDPGGRHPARDPHVWSLCQRLVEKNRGHFRIVASGETGCKVMIRFAREMLV